MSELYWLTVVGNLKVMFVAVLIVSLFVLVLCFIAIGDTQPESKALFTAIKVSLIGLVVSIVGLVFTPSTKQLYVIYGVGSVIDYYKNSDEAQKLPDNAVKAINLYLESMPDKETKGK